MTERPAIYVHFEFGVSWPRHPPRNHQVTYMSRSMRDRANQFPRLLPPANTNFLAAPVAYSYPTQPQPQAAPQPQLQPQIQQQPPAGYQQHSNWNQPRAATLPTQTSQTAQYPPRQPAQVRWQELQPQRTSRSQSRSSHERGRSAPPPFNGSPWDAEPEPMTATLLPRASRTRGQPEIWKDLPATPNQYRLGEEGMPWSYAYPAGWVEDGEDTASDVEPEASMRTYYPPEPSRRREVDERDTGKAREMQSLATALMTVDNGFEDQWWYQGPRILTMAGDLMTPTALPPAPRDGTVGWAVSREDQNQQNQMQSPVTTLPDFSPRPSIVEIVSPISDFSSPVSSYRGLRRSLTTRSDELHM